MALCGNCNLKVDRDSELKVQCGDCSTFFHSACVALKLPDIQYINKEKIAWRCNKCISLRKGNYDNLGNSSPIQPTVLKKSYTTVQQSSDILNEIKLLRHDFNKKLDGLATEFKTLDVNLSEKINGLIEENKNLKEVSGKLQVENNKFKKEINYLKHQIHNLDQQQHTNSIEITGVPLNNDDDVFTVVQNVVRKAFDLNIQLSDVDICYKKTIKPKQYSDVVNTNSAPVIMGKEIIHVKFVSKLTKNQIMRQVLNKKNLTAFDCGFVEKNRVFFNDSLCYQRRVLFKAAKEAKDKNNYKYCWIRSGQIMMRKIEKGPIKYINSSLDLEDI